MDFNDLIYINYSSRWYTGNSWSTIRHQCGLDHAVCSLCTWSLHILMQVFLWWAHLELECYLRFIRFFTSVYGATTSFPMILSCETNFETAKTLSRNKGDVDIVGRIKFLHTRQSPMQQKFPTHVRKTFAVPAIQLLHWSCLKGWKALFLITNSFLDRFLRNFLP